MVEVTLSRLLQDRILCIGELLWDLFPEGRHLGGAPPNVAVHLQALGERSYIASRVGKDEAGDALLAQLHHLGAPTDLIQVDPARPTGVVTVDLSDAQAPRYTIEHPAAWDFIERTTELAEFAASCRAVIFGSLAQRSAASRATIRSVLPDGVLRVFDVNLRPPFDDRDVVEASLERCDIVKLNEDELERLRGWFGLPAGDQNASRSLCSKFGCTSVCVTRGPRGAAILHEGRWHAHPGYPVRAVDTVGAGDAFLAALLSRIIHGVPAEDALRLACAVGAYVATQPGATPPLDTDSIVRLMSTG